jgi:hypothetical protein
VTTTDLLPWAPVLTFNAGPGRPLPFPEIRYKPPTSTVDPRYAACRQHRVACDCREGHMAEDRAELRYYADENRLMEQGIDAVLALHGKGPTGRCSAPDCFGTYPCPTRNLLAPLSWREQMEAKR